MGKARDPVMWLEKDFGMGRGQALDIILQRKHLPNCPVEYGAFEMLRTSTLLVSLGDAAYLITAWETRDVC